jgi:hypothetical protein
VRIDMDIEDKVLAAFGTGGILSMLAGVLQTSGSTEWEALGGLLVAIGVTLKAFISKSS